MRYPALVLFSIGCSPAFNGTKTFSNNESYENPNDEYNDFFSQSGLPELREDMDPHYCDDQEIDGQEINAAGAASYFLGTYVQEEERWIGKERWYLFPTPEWVAAEDMITEDGCYVTWEIEATEIDCVDCDLALSAMAGVNRSETNCPDELWDNPADKEWEANYDIDINGDSAEFYFQSSGEFIGRGYSNSTAASFLSDVTCTWF